MRFVSYAQNGEDVVLWRALGDAGAGFYVDVGAAHPDADSVTRAFYDRGWRGINVEPVPALAERIAASRPRDVTLSVAAGAEPGAVTLHVLDGTGLSTTSAQVLASLGAVACGSQALQVPVRTLAAILDEHAPDRIDFLKIDVEGAERAVLEGGDFRRHRPRVVLVEATWPNSDRPSHAEWEGLLLGAGYRFALFDGLNRFYVADEWQDALAPRLAAPANVLDNFVRVADAEAARHEADREGQLARAMVRARVAEESGRAAYARAFEQARDLANLHHGMAGLEFELREARARLQRPDARLAEWQAHAEAMAARAEALARAHAEAQRLLAETRRSTSWRLTAPLRAVVSLARPAVPPGPAIEVPPPAAPPPAPAPEVAPERLREPARAPEPGPAILRATHAPGPFRTVHQFHSGSATGDAVTASMMLIRDRLRRLGYRSEIFVEHRDPALAGALRLLAELPARADHVLIVHHSMGYAALGRILAHPAPKLLYYHNITPPELLPAASPLPGYAALGREQLALLREAVVGAVGASEYNAAELRRAGFDPVWAATLLVDVDALRARAAEAAPRQPDHPYTVLFVGRVVESKGQAELVSAFARFRARLGRTARLVLAGRLEGAGPYLQAIDDAMRAHGLEQELVLTGTLSDAELHAQYAAADLYVSLSRHEGFGVPLVEAMAHGIPVLAWAGGAVPYTLGDEAGLLQSRDPDAVAAAMLDVARDPARRAALLAGQRAALDCVAPDRQFPALQQALLFAGAAPPPDPAMAASLAAHLRFAVFGHAAGSYSLAAVNRALARAIEAERPGRVRLIPVADEAGALPPDAARLAARPPPETGPELVISQHYPVLVPPAGDLALALVFWEESLLPAATIAILNRDFAAVLAPSAFVAKALVESGLTRPVHVIGQAPDLARFEAIAAARERREAGPFTFLHVSSCFPRKGVDALLAAYAGAFRRGDAVRLVIKGFPNPHNTVPAQVAAWQEADPGLAPIEVIDRDLEESAMLDLYRAADAMVLPSRGEGFNLPAAEAIAAGLPLIVTGFGGQLEFCGADTARLLRYRLAPSGSHLASLHSLWAEPDPADLVAALREAVATDPATLAASRARVGRARAAVRERLGGRRLVRRLQLAALDALLRPPPAPLVVGWISTWGVRCGVAEYSRHLLGAMPDHPAIAAHVVFADARSPAAPEASARVHPAWTLADPGSLDRLQGAILAEDPSVLVIQHQPGLMPWPMLADLLASPALVGRAVVLTLHNSRDLLEGPADQRQRVGAALAGLSRVIVHTLADLHGLQDIGLVDNVALVPHGVREALPRTTPRPAGAAPLIGCYGFFLPGKGIYELIEALALLRATRPEARLRLVNARYDPAWSDPEIARCRARAAQLGLQAAIEWHTEFLPDEESLALLAPCDAVAMPTQASRESSSAAVRTALAAGPPVLTTPLPLFEDVGPAVRRAAGIDPQALAAALEEMLSQPEATGRLQADAAAWLRARAWPDVARLFQGMLLGLAPRP